MVKPCENCIDVTKFGCGPIGSDNIIYTGPNLPCSNINTKETLTEAIQKIDAILCGLPGTQGLQETLNVGNVSTDISAIFRSSSNSNLSTISFDGIRIEDSTKYIMYSKEGIYFSINNTTIKPESAGSALINLLVPTKTIAGTYIIATTDQIPSSANFITTDATNQTKAGNLTVNAIIKNGGTPFEYLMADGSTSNLSTIVLAILTSNVLSGDTTHAPTGDAVYNALLAKESLSNKVNVISGSSSIEYPTENAVVNYVNSAVTTVITQNIINGDTTHAPSGDAVYDALALKEDLANKVNVISGSSSTEYPTEKAVVDYVTSQSGGNFAKIVYVNSTDPTTATIFDLNNPPVINDNSLKNDINNLYIGTDASTWVYITSPAGYITKAVVSSSSNFFFAGTLIDAAGNKNSAIERTGTVGGANGTANNHFITKFQLDHARTVLSYACADEVSDMTVGTLITFRMPIGLTLTSLKLSLNNAPTGTKLIVDVRKGGVTILSTLISVDIGSTTSVGAAVPYVISDSNLVDDSIITILTTQVGSTSAGKGLKVSFIGNKI